MSEQSKYQKEQEQRIVKLQGQNELKNVLEAAPSALTAMAYCFTVTRLHGAAQILPTPGVDVYALLLDRLFYRTKDEPLGTQICRQPSQDSVTMAS